MSNKKYKNKKRKDRQSKHFLIALGVFGIFAIAIFTAILFSGKNSVDVNETGNIVIDASEITEKAEFFTHRYEGKKMEFFAVRDNSGNIRMAFNRCQVCYDSGRGYFIQDGNEFECQNCGNRYKISAIGNEKGGCNPSPITASDKIVNGDSIEIKESIFQEYSYMF